MKYAKNTWYPLAWSHDITRSLTRRTVVEEDVVLYRKQDGEVVALEDLCPHRFTPLSMGRLKGDAIECGYHGLTFDCSGKCIRIPGQPIIASNAVVRSFPVAENMGLVWIWTGNPELADRSKIYDLPQYHDPNWSVLHGDALLIHAHYLDLADNLCDPSHVSFVHQTTLGNQAGEEVPVHHEKQGNAVVTWRWIIDSPAIPLFAKLNRFKGNVDRWHYYHYYTPSTCIIDFGSADTGTGAPQGDRSNCVQMYSCHFITPLDERTSIDHWLEVRNFHQNDSAMDKWLHEELRNAFAEDKAILEAIQKEKERRPDRRPLRLAIDASPVRMRHTVERMIAEESGSPAAAAKAR